MKTKAQTRKLTSILNNLSKSIQSEEIKESCRIDTSTFSRNRLIPVETLLNELIFRHHNTANKDISFAFQERRAPSKQALIKREGQLNPKVWRVLLKKLREEMDSAGLMEKRLKGYRLIAIDGTTLELPPSKKLNQVFGGYLNQYYPTRESLLTPVAKLSSAYDPLNHQFLDVIINECNTSEIPMMFEHFDRLFNYLKGEKVIFLLDRYYGSVEFFLWCRLNGFNYIVRAKKSFFKHQRALVEEKQDVILKIEVDKAWRKRLKREEIRNYAAKEPELKVRLIKSDYNYTEQNRVKAEAGTYYTKRVEKSCHSEYFTDLNEDIFSPEEIVSLYHDCRWPIEVAYDVLKNDLEITQVHTTDPIAIINMVLAKFLLFNLEKSIFHIARNILEEKGLNDIPNNKKIISEVYSFVFFSSFVKARIKTKLLLRIIKESIRLKRKQEKDRHYQRWGRYFKAIPHKRFRIGGRKNPIVKAAPRGGGYITVKN